MTAADGDADGDGGAYRAGIVGAGGVAGMGIFGAGNTEVGLEPEDASHAGGYAGADGVELVAVADVDADARRRFGEAWGVPESGRYDSHEAMFEAEDLDVVSVCTPSMLHREHVVDAAEVGDPDVIWCEKPLACSVGDAEEATAVCEDEGVELVVNHSRRFMDATNAVREAVEDEDLLGEVRTAAGASSMELLRVGTHVVDLLVFLLGERAAEVAGHVTGENESAEHLADRRVDDAGGGGFVRTQAETFVTFEGVASRDIAPSYCRLVGTEGRLVNDDRGWTYFERTGEGAFEQAVAPTGDRADDYERSFVNAAEHAVALADGAVENRSPGREACHTLEILLGFYVSSETGGRVSVPFADPLKDVTVTSW
jgi:predicted dehydrogenase